jgi:hypothetical protein
MDTVNRYLPMTHVLFSKVLAFVSYSLVTYLECTFPAFESIQSVRMPRCLIQ